MFAKELQRTLPPQTPSQTEGSFYPNRLSLDTLGNPLRNATVEIWQVDNQGPYLYTDSARRKGYDKNFRGFVRFLTNSRGEYYFRTIKPVADLPPLTESMH